MLREIKERSGGNRGNPRESATTRKKKKKKKGEVRNKSGEEMRSRAAVDT